MRILLILAALATLTAEYLVLRAMVKACRRDARLAVCIDTINVQESRGAYPRKAECVKLARVCAALFKKKIRRTARRGSKRPKERVFVILPSATYLRVHGIVVGVVAGFFIMADALAFGVMSLDPGEWVLMGFFAMVFGMAVHEQIADIMMPQIAKRRAMKLASVLVENGCREVHFDQRHSVGETAEITVAVVADEYARECIRRGRRTLPEAFRHKRKLLEAGMAKSTV